MNRQLITELSNLVNVFEVTNPLKAANTKQKTATLEIPSLATIHLSKALAEIACTTQLMEG